MKDESQSKEKDKPKTKKFKWGWPIKVLLLTLSLSLVFSISSEFLLSRVGIILSLTVLIVFITISVVFDMIGVAVTATDIEPFLAMASRKEKGAKEAISLIKNAEKISSFCCDIVGDICGILSGAVGATVVAKIAIATSDSLMIIIAALISSGISALMVFGKALGKSYAINSSVSIIKKVSKIMCLFKFEKKPKAGN